MSASTRTAALSHGGRKDPTQTTTIRRRYAQRLRGALGRIMAAAREGIVQDDVFGLRGGQAALAELPEVFDYPTDSGKIQAFLRWLRKQLRQDYLTVVTRNENRFIQAAYARGLKHATSALREAGVDVPEDANVQAALNLPIHQRTLQQLYSRNFRLLEGITRDMGREISEELTAGFAEGENARKIARRVSNRVQTVGKTRSEVLARSEVINAHSESTLTRFEGMGVDTVQHGEWSAAMDERTCPICRHLDGQEFTIDEMRNGTFRFRAEGEDVPDHLAGEYRLKPPAHPQGRCSILPVV